MSTTKEQWQSSEKPRVLGASVFPCWAHLLCSPPSLGFLGRSYGRVCSQCGDQSSIPGWWGRSPGEGNGYSLQYSCLENSMDRGASWVTVHGVAESDTTKRLTGSVFSFTPSIPSIWYPLVTVNPAYFILQTPLSALPLALSQVGGGVIISSWIILNHLPSKPLSPCYKSCPPGHLIPGFQSHHAQLHFGCVFSLLITHPKALRYDGVMSKPLSVASIGPFLHR